MKLLRQNIETGTIYRRSELELFSTAIDRNLSQLVADGTLVKIQQGMYYAPVQSKFGALPPDEMQLIESFLKDDHFLAYSPNLFNTLGLGLTQLYNITRVYNHKRKGELMLNGKKYSFILKSRFPKNITKEFLLVDLLDNTDFIQEDYAQILDKLKKNITGFDIDELRNVLTKYCSTNVRKILTKILKTNNLQYA